MDKRKIILILGFAGFVAMADNWVVSPILPSIAQDLNVDVPSASIIITAYMLPFGLFQLLYGYLAERLGKRQVITISISLFTIATALCAFAFSISDLAVYRALTGMFAAAVMPVSLALIGDIFPMEERQSAIGSFMGISFLGQGLSMAIGGSIAQFLNWRGVFAVYAGLAVISSVLLFTIGRKIPSAKNKESKALMPYINLLRNPSSLMIYALVVFEGLFLLGSFSFLGGFIKTTFNLNNFAVGMVMTAFGIMALLAGRKSGTLAAKIGRKKTAAIGLSFAFLADMLLASIGDFLPIVVIAVGLMGFGFMMAHSTFLTIATEFAAKARGIAMSLVAFCFMGGGGIGTAIGGHIVSVSSFERLFIVYGIGLMLITVSTFFVKSSFRMRAPL
ncbi:arabinose efflux permease family protein [Desulfosporosinus orientis DSM 765]|uniref:Arabinose efflux permease family protein n=1 Tax=Desulfosporosinus orientis (strain ATCC 19365 / DSM 765 / NCIMB 8382 / VKM B-1628 / Singapore I) TaxID=768706 RepID=G7W8X6_DESOD|nr:MFS transporter [Desulfosporosinus orientis]AET68185.1 arabinose efflux permease family protein [Desulfosporosinus orientis DSM 765]